jgi:hypothetical protein
MKNGIELTGLCISMGCLFSSAYSSEHTIEARTIFGSVFIMLIFNTYQTFRRTLK